MTDRPTTRGALRQYGEQGGNVPGAELSGLAERIKAKREAATPEASAERRTAILDGLRSQIGERDPETTGSVLARLTHTDTTTTTEED